MLRWHPTKSDFHPREWTWRCDPILSVTRVGNFVFGDTSKGSCLYRCSKRNINVDSWVRAIPQKSTLVSGLTLRKRRWLIYKASWSYMKQQKLKHEFLSTYHCFYEEQTTIILIVVHIYKVMALFVSISANLMATGIQLFSPALHTALTSFSISFHLPISSIKEPFGTRNMVTYTPILMTSVRRLPKSCFAKTSSSLMLRLLPKLMPFQSH